MPFDINNTIEIEFYNETTENKILWVELACEQIILDAQTEYKIVSDDKSFRIVFKEKIIVLYLQNRFGFKLYKRKYGTTVWILDADLSDIN